MHGQCTSEPDNRPWTGTVRDKIPRPETRKGIFASEPAHAANELFAENLGCVVFGVDLADCIDDDSVLVDYVGGTESAERPFAVEFFESPRLVSLKDGAVGVAEQMEWK